jgi:hypothetical protein
MITLVVIVSVFIVAFSVSMSLSLGERDTPIEHENS